MLTDDGQFSDDEWRQLERLRAVHVGRKAAQDAMPPFLSDAPHANLPTLPDVPDVPPGAPVMRPPAERWAIVVERQADRLAALRSMQSAWVPLVIVGRVAMRGIVTALRKDRRVIALLSLWLALSLADLFTTWLGLTRQGGTEAIPLYAVLYGTFPFMVGAVVKLLVTALIALYCCWQYTRWRVGAYVLLAVGAVVLALPVIHNVAGLVAPH